MKKISTKVLIPVVLLAVIAVISAVTGLKNANELHTSSKEISDTTVNQLMLLNDISSNFKSIDAITYRMCVSTSKDERGSADGAGGSVPHGYSDIDRFL